MLRASDGLDFRLGVITGPSPESWPCAGSVCGDCIVLEEVGAGPLIFRTGGDGIGGVPIAGRWVASTLIFHGPVEPDLGKGIAVGEISPRRVLTFIFDICENDREGPIKV